MSNTPAVREKERVQRTSLTDRDCTVKNRQPGEPMRKAIPKCGTCADLPHRRNVICPECKRFEQAEKLR